MRGVGICGVGGWRKQHGRKNGDEEVKGSLGGKGKGKEI